MRFFMLKFTYGVEIGAHLAYLGHWERTNDMRILDIAFEEREHQLLIEGILKYYGHKTNTTINKIFYFIGSIIKYLCLISPLFLLNLVATCLEVFAVFSYDKLAKLFPEFETLLNRMEETEQKHIDFFKNYERIK